MGNISCYGRIPPAYIGIIERFGRYNRVVYPGFFIKLPFIDNLKYVVSCKKKQLIITIDNMFCKVVVAVIYSVKQDSVYDAVYGYENFEELVNSYVQNEIMSEVSRTTLQKLTISDKVKKSLEEKTSLGYNIHDVLINDIEQKNHLTKEEKSRYDTLVSKRRVVLKRKNPGCGVSTQRLTDEEIERLISSNRSLS